MKRAIALGFLLVVGCAGTPKRPVAQPSGFPTQADVERLRRAPKPEPQALTGGARVAEWSLDAGRGFVALRVAQPRPGLEQAVPSRPGRGWFMSQAAQCAATEMARYMAVNRGLTPQDVQESVNLRCGTQALTFTSFFWTLDDAPDLALDAFGRKVAPDVRARLDELPADDPLELGVGYAKHAGRAVCVLLHGKLRARIQATSLAQGQLTVRGTLLEASERIDGLVTFGRHAVGTCLVDSKVALPNFRLDCATDPADSMVRFTLFGQKKGRILGSALLRAEFSPTPTPTAHLRRASSVGRLGAPALLSVVNGSRAEAGLPPLELEPDQTAISQDVAPLLFGDRSASKVESDVIALGLLAGYAVPKPIVDGHFAFDIGPRLDPAGTVKRLLREPAMRRVLMHPAADRVALAVLEAEEPGGLGVVATTFAGPPPEVTKNPAAAVRARIDAARQRAGLPRSGAASFASDARVELMAMVEKNEATVQWVAQELVQRAARRRRGTQFLVLSQQIARLDDFEVPAQLLAGPRLDLQVETVLYRPLGAPWHSMLIVLVFPDPGRQAARPAPTGEGLLAYEGRRPVQPR